jgi:hypothetical protein
MFAELDATEMLNFWEAVEGAVSKWKRNQAFQWQYLSDEVGRAEKEYGSKARSPLSSMSEYFS